MRYSSVILHRLRRYSSALAGLMLAQVVLLAASQLCLSNAANAHGAAHVDAATVAQDHHSHGASNHELPAQDVPVDRDERSENCQATMNCAVTVLLAAHTSVPESRISMRSRVLVTKSTVLESISGAPETPPPRA